MKMKKLHTIICGQDADHLKKRIDDSRLSIKIIQPQNLKDHLLENQVHLCVVSGQEVLAIIQSEFEQYADTVFLIISPQKYDSKLPNVLAFTAFLPATDSRDLIKNLINYIVFITQRNEFNANLIHDFKSPLNSIVGYLDLLESGVFGELKKGQAKLLSNVMLLADALIELTDDFGIMQKIETKSLGLKKIPFDILKVIDEVLKNIWIQTDKKDIKIHKIKESDHTLVIGDPAKIQRVLINILSNAVKFSSKKAEIWVKISRLDDQYVKIAIKDQGIGIKPQYLSRVFSKYKQFSDKRTNEGLGLGLYISKSIIVSHKGKIWAENNSDKGCTFSFSLPAYLK